MEKRRWWVTLGTALLMIGVIAAGDKIGHDNEIQTEVEVVQYWKESDSVLATTGEQGGLFTFQMPQSGDMATGADLTRCGTLLRITGGEEWLTSYPMQYPNVREVEYIGMREDFVKTYFDGLKKKTQGMERQEIVDEVEKISELNEGEKEALVYLLCNEQGIW
ncbi:MAG TPA: hypothetical protein H9943_08185 [Candidatus Ruthenibacterium avium]|uniref:Uncharacterized protein n=1 Tax=Candidatus Ruthenibacterium avium TaxID=2838751 RepID=A0A9D2M4S0_9FIRM|nr:hypothetical protein [Candidatus Ruthenibacterium avium]